MAAAVPVVAAVGRLLNRKTPSLPGNEASRIGCEKESPADSLGSEYRRRDLRNGNWQASIFHPHDPSTLHLFVVYFLLRLPRQPRVIFFHALKEFTLGRYNKRY